MRKALDVAEYGCMHWKSVLHVNCWGGGERQKRVIRTNNCRPTKLSTHVSSGSNDSPYTSKPQRGE